MTPAVERRCDLVDRSHWKVAWAAALDAFTVRPEGTTEAVTFDELDEIEVAIGGALPWSVRARLETDRHQALEEQAERWWLPDGGGAGSSPGPLRGDAAGRRGRRRGRAQR